MITFDGEVLAMQSMRIDIQFELKDKDISGQSSLTNVAEQGDKGKKLTISGLIAFSDMDQLARLYELASAKDDKGNRYVYRIGNDIARTLKIRQARFSGRINTNEHSSQLAWSVSFSLSEHSSIAEKKQIRERKKDGQASDTLLENDLKEAEKELS